MPRIPSAPETMQLQYSQLEDLVAAMLDVHSDRRKTLGARIRLFRQRGFPPDVSIAGKSRFGYDLNAVLRMAVAFLMLDAFIPQETVPPVVERDWKILQDAFRTAFSLVAEKGEELAATSPDRPLLLISPRNLHGFTLKKEQGAAPADSVRLQIVTARGYIERLAALDEDAEFGPATMIEIQRLAAWVRNAILAPRWAGPELFAQFAAS